MGKDKAKKTNENEPVTKKEFNERLDKVDNRFDKNGIALQNLAKAVLSNTEDIRIIKETMVTKHDHKRVIDTLDIIVKKMEDFENKGIINTHRINEIEPKIDNHEKRITTLETVIQK
ncbi:MAG: hypothetical protein LHV68_02830 [Elusimicrobia bacterium]|nr:hypothetical protein [Candidatus Liberimonas magnetica]